MVLFPSRRRVRALAWRLRFLAAAVCCGLAAVVMTHALSPPAPATTAVVVAARSVAAGTVLGPDDVRVRRIPARLVPDGSFASLDEVIGRTTSVAVTAGLPLVDTLTGHGSTADIAPAGTVVAPIRLDPAIAELLTPGDRVDLLGTSDPIGQSGEVPDSGPYLARSAVVVPAPSSGHGGLLDVSASSGVVLVAVSPEDAVRIAARSSWEEVTAVLVP